jgi:prepilin-type N-terminal cleavage/methylation domain-containing protein/prepilin-type processing-associated H-X9-DG protein
MVLSTVFRHLNQEESTMGRGRTGFTLIELLVVIAIIAILASILFPVFSRARAKGRQTACLSNEHQLVMAMLMYAQDYDESFPYSFALSPTNPGYYSQRVPLNPAEWQWYDALYAYTHNRDIDLCPEIKNVLPGYGMNAVLSGQSLGIMFDAAKKVVVIDFADPQRMGQYHGRSSVNVGNCIALGGIAADPLLSNQYAARHNDGYNASYGDGHSKFATRGNLENAINWDPTVQ